MGIRVSNIARQIGALGQHLTKEQRRAWDAGFTAMGEEMGGVLEAKMAECFAKQQEPDGTRWAPMSPLTKAIYTEDGKSHRLGGNAMRQSFNLGARGNVFKVQARKGIVYGSNQKHGRYVVARTFAENFRMPRSAGDVRKAQRIRNWMQGKVGIPAPKPGGQLHHPARPLIYWTPKWEEALTKVAINSLALSLQQAASTAQAAVDRVKAAPVAAAGGGVTDDAIAARQRVEDAFRSIRSGG